MNDWEKYIDDRLIKKYENFVVIKPNDDIQTIPLFCPLCDTLMKSRYDEEEFIEFSCCYFCAATWAHPRRQLWKEGYRPDKNLIEQEKINRPPIKFVLIDD